MTIDDSLLRGLVPLNALPVSLRRHLGESAAVLTLAGGETLFREGESDDAVYYVLRGAVVVVGPGARREKVEAGGEAARHPLAPALPRTATATTAGPAEVLRLNRTLLDTSLFWTQATGAADEQPGPSANDWLVRMAATPLFSRIPPENIEKVLAQLERVPFAAGDAVLRQGEPGDYYYIVERGGCAVSRRVTGKLHDIRLAELGPGDCFGEEALITSARRNANVTMLTDGVVRRLSKDQFIRLIQKPLIRELDLAAARSLTQTDQVVWLDVRLPEEHAKTGIKDSLNIPLARLRAKMDTLDATRRYVVYCDSGARSAAATFLMLEKGLDAFHLQGGIINRTRDAARPPSGRVVAAAREAQRHRLELVRADGEVESAVRRSAHAAGVHEAAATIHQHQQSAGVGGQALEAALEKDRARFREQAEITEQALEKAQQHRLELATETAILERLSDDEISRAGQEEHAARAAAEERLRSGEERLEALYQKACDALERTRMDREHFETEAAATRGELENAAEEAAKRLADIDRQRELAAAALKKARDQLAGHDTDAAARRQALMAQELKVRQRTHKELDAERKRLETEFAQVTAELEELRHARHEAEEARRLAAAEAERAEAARRAAPPPDPEPPAPARSPRPDSAVARLDEETTATAARLDDARDAYAAAEAELKAVLEVGDDGDLSATREAAVQDHRARVEQARQDMEGVEVAHERLRLTREILNAGNARGEEMADTLRERLARELEEWVARETQNEARNRELSERLQDDIVKAQNEALKELKAEEEATAHMLDEVRSQLDSMG